MYFKWWIQNGAAGADRVSGSAGRHHESIFKIYQSADTGHLGEAYAPDSPSFRGRAVPWIEPSNVFSWNYILFPVHIYKGIDVGFCNNGNIDMENFVIVDACDVQEPFSHALWMTSSIFSWISRQIRRAFCIKDRMSFKTLCVSSWGEFLLCFPKNRKMWLSE